MMFEQYDSSEDDSDFDIVVDDSPGGTDMELGDLSRDGVDLTPEGEADEMRDVVDLTAAGGSDGNMNQMQLVMPARKLKEPSPVWNCADKVEGGAKCKFCLRYFKCTLGSTSSICNHLLTKHGDIEAVKTMQSDVKKKKAALKVKRLQDFKKKSSNKQPSILNFSKRRGIMDPLKKKKLDEALVKMTIAMNRPFSDVENHFFRKVIFVAEPNYLCPSRTRNTSNFDGMAKKVKKDLEEEINKDITDAGHKTLTICTDHGTSADKFRTKKNAVTVARTTKDFVIKKDTLKLMVCEVPQTGAQIRKDVKKALMEGAGWKEGVKINWVTDNESKQINARNPLKHHAIGLPTFHVGSCVDHTCELGCEESTQQCSPMNDSLGKVRGLINYVKESSTAKTAFKKIMENAGAEPLAIIQGTSNRWFFKYTEVHRALLLREHIDTFFDTFDIPATLDKIEEEDWQLLLVYENAMKRIVDSAKVLEGELYPTASSVIPFLDTIFEDLKMMKQSLQGPGKQFVEKLLANLQRRFQGGYKQVAPYNCLTLLDIRYADLYFNAEEFDKAVDDLSNDAVYDEVLLNGGVNNENPVPVLQAVPPQPDPQQDSFTKRRAQLLAAKQVTGVQEAQQSLPLKEKIKAELTRYLQFRGSLDPKENPNTWWRVHHSQFPLLKMFWLAHSAFPATSASAERVFNMDGLILSPCRKSLDPQRTGDMILCRDYWLSREGADESFQLCQQCPNVPNEGACYKISCSKHNTPANL